MTGTRSKGTKGALTIRERFGVSLRDLLGREKVTILILVLRHSVPNGFSFGRFDESHRFLKESTSIWKERESLATCFKARDVRGTHC